jgi:hypothetical protein
LVQLRHERLAVTSYVPSLGTAARRDANSRPRAVLALQRPQRPERLENLANRIYVTARYRANVALAHAGQTELHDQNSSQQLSRLVALTSSCRHRQPFPSQRAGRLRLTAFFLVDRAVPFRLAW